MTTPPNPLAREFVQMKLKADALRQYQLPNIGYPVPWDALSELLETEGELPFAYLLFWLQNFSRSGKRDWTSLEPAMMRLTELIAPEDAHTTGTVRGDNWFLELRAVDLGGPLVTIQRGDHVIAALQPRTDGTLACSAFRPLDAKSIRYLIGISRLPGPDGSVCMRPNNWEYALDQAAHSTAAFYACERGEAYLSLWEQGLGVGYDGSIDQGFMNRRELSPIEPRLAATQMGIYYELSSDGDL